MEGSLGRRYNMEVQVFSPTDLGIPSNRLRKCTAFHLSAWVEPCFKVPFETVFFRDLVRDGAI